MSQPPPQPMVRTVFMLPVQVHRELVAEAQRRDRTLAWLLRRSVMDWLEQNVNPKDA